MLLNRQIIANGALKIIEEVGYEKLTMARIAREIEVAPSALYNHVANKRDLLILVEDEVMAKVDTTLLDAALRGDVEPVEGLYRWAESYREVFARHTPLVEVIAGMRISGAPRAVEMYEKSQPCLVRLGSKIRWFFRGLLCSNLLFMALHSTSMRPRIFSRFPKNMKLQFRH